MKIDSASCPRCGGILTINGNETKVKCDYCDSVLIIDKEIKSANVDKTKGNNQPYNSFQKYKESYSIQQDSLPNQQANVTKRKRHTFLWILGWIFIFPVPITILVYRSENLNRITKIVLIAIAWIVYLFIGRVMNN